MYVLILLEKMIPSLSMLYTDDEDGRHDYIIKMYDMWIIVIRCFKANQLQVINKHDMWGTHPTRSLFFNAVFY